MGGGGGLNLPGVGAGDLGAGIAAVVDQGDKLHIDVLGQDVGHGGADAAQVQLVLDAQHQPGLPQGERRGEVKVLPHPLQQRLGGDAGGSEELGRQVLGGQQVQQVLPQLALPQGLLLLRQLPLGLRQLRQGRVVLASRGHGLRMLEEVGGQRLPRGVQGLEIGEEAALEHRVPQLVQGVGVGQLAGDGEVFDPVHAVGLAQLDQAENGPVLILPLLQKAGVEGQVVGGAVSNQQPAVAVGDDAPGGLHGLRSGDGVDGLGGVVLVVDHLDAVQNAQIDQQDGRQQNAQKIEAKITGFVLIHENSL